MNNLVNKTVIEFLEPWKKNPDFIGALITGSQVTKFVNKYSDIDVYIVLSDHAEFREIGATKLNGFIVEYFINPVKQINSYFEQEKRIGICMTSRMLAMGKIIYDKEDIILGLKKKAEENSQKLFGKIEGARLDMIKYGIWEAVERFETSSKSGYKAVDFNYNYALLEIVRGYSRYLGLDVGAVPKMWEFFNNKEYRKAYKMVDFPDRKFVKLFDKAISATAKNAKLFAMENISRHILTEMGGFEIAKFRLVSELDL